MKTMAGIQCKWDICVTVRDYAHVYASVLAPCCICVNVLCAYDQS